MAITFRPQDAAALMQCWWPTLPPDSEGTVSEPTVPWRQLLAELAARQWLVDAGRWALAQGASHLAMTLARRALQARQDAATWRAVCRIAYEAASLDDAVAWAAGLETSTPPPGPGEHKLISAIRERQSLFDRLNAPPASAPPVDRVDRRVLNLLAYSLPYTSNGYATRSHGLLTAVQGLGWDTRPFTRPGYPADSDAALQDVPLPPSDGIDTLTYGRLFRSSRRQLGQMAYLHAAADEIREQATAFRVQLVHAASNYMTALPACLAAREAGLPFVYEVRGFWDVTRISNDPAFAQTTEYRYLRRFESALLARADALVTLTDTMKIELVARGASADRIFVAPNAVDAERLTPLPRSAAQALELHLPPGIPVIGYVGSFVDYEGLDDLVEACCLLRDSGKPFHLLLVGDGLAWSAIRDLIEARGLQSCATLTGRVAHELVASAYAAIDVCPFPRKPWPVCELVSPLKPLEAMALEKAVVVSSVSAMAEMVQAGSTGEIYAKGDARALASALGQLLDDPQRAREMGQMARRWVLDHRTWQASAAAVEKAYLAATLQAEARIWAGHRG